MRITQQRWRRAPKWSWPPKDEDYGGRGYSCRDPEVNLWNFGSYNPWEDA